MIQFGMRVHDLCPKGPLLTVLDSIHDADIKHVQLAFGKSVSDYDFSVGHYTLVGRNIHDFTDKNSVLKTLHFTFHGKRKLID